MEEQYMKQLADTVNQQQEQITNLVQLFQQMPGVQEPVRVNVQPAVIAAEVIRTRKFRSSCQKMTFLKLVIHPSQITLVQKF